MKLQWIQVILAPTAAVKITLGQDDKGSVATDIELQDREVTILSEKKEWDAEAKVMSVQTSIKVMNLENAIAWEYKELPVGQN